MPVQTFVLFVLPLSSLLLLRISPTPFAFIPIPPMSLSSRNRSISNTFRHILPRIAPVCEGMHYHKTGVPWQMNKIFIIIFFPPEMPRFALFYALFWHFHLVIMILCCNEWIQSVKQSISSVHLHISD